MSWAVLEYPQPSGGGRKLNTDIVILEMTHLDHLTRKFFILGHLECDASMYQPIL